MKRHLSFLLITLLAFVTTQVRADQENQLQIGAVLCLTGDCASYGNSALKGCELAAYELNSAGGVLGRKVKIVAEDSVEASNVSGTISAFQRLKSSLGISFFVGPTWTPAGQALAPILSKDENVIASSPSIGVGDFSQAGSNLFNFRGTDNQATDELARYAISQGWKKVAIFSTQQSWEKIQADNFQNTFTSLNGVVTTRQDPLPDTLDAKTHALKIVRSQPDAVFFATIIQLAQAAKSLRSLNYSGPLIAVYIDETRLKEAGKAIEGLVFTDLSLPSAAFVEKYKNHFGADVVEPPSAIAYDIVMQYAKSIKSVGSFDLKAIRDNIKNSTISGASGTFTFDSNRNANRKPVFRIVKNGKISLNN